MSTELVTTQPGGDQLPLHIFPHVDAALGVVFVPEGVGHEENLATVLQFHFDEKVAILYLFAMVRLTQSGTRVLKKRF